MPGSMNEANPKLYLTLKINAWGWQQPTDILFKFLDDIKNVLNMQLYYFKPPAINLKLPGRRTVKNTSGGTRMD